jgi:maleate isomerase/arylmalonate decarboxylase
MPVSIAMIVPPANTVNEAEWRRMAPDLHLPLVRMPLHAHADETFFSDLRRFLLELRAQKPDVIAYACTATSMVLPLETLPDFIEKEAGVPGVATAPALVLAARELGMEKVAVATPYHDELNQHEKEFFEACGLQVLGIRGLGIGAGGPHEYVRIAKVSPEEVHEHCLSSWVPGADGMIVSCTDFRTLEALPRLERSLGKPVVSSNLATLWLALRRAGAARAVRGFGRLLEA